MQEWSCRARPWAPVVSGACGTHFLALCAHFLRCGRGRFAALVGDSLRRTWFVVEQLAGGVGGSAGGAKAGPGLAHDQAVAGVVGVVAHLDGLVQAEAADTVAKHGDILGAVVDDATEAIAEEEDFGLFGEAFVAAEVAGVEQKAVGDAAARGEELAAAAFDLFGRGAMQADVKPKAEADQQERSSHGSGDTGIDPMQGMRQLVEVALQGWVPEVSSASIAHLRSVAPTCGAWLGSLRS